MRWRRRDRPGVERLEVPLDELDAADLELLEVDAGGHLSGLRRWKDDDSLREVPYRPSLADAGSLAGVWEGLARC